MDISIMANETQAVDLGPLFEDSASDTLTYMVTSTAVDNIVTSAINNTTNMLTLAGVAANADVQNITIVASDSAGNTSPTYTIQVTVVADTTSPTLSGGVASMDISIMANETQAVELGPLFSDSASDTLTYMVTSTAVACLCDSAR